MAEINSKDMSNIEEVLSLIASCVDGGGNNTAASQLLVGFNDSSISRLSLAIKGGSKELKDEIKKGNSENNKTSERTEKLLADYIPDILGLAKEDAKRQEKIEKEITQGWKALRHPIISFSRNFPMITSFVSGIWDITKSLYDIQVDNLNNYKDLIANGVLYQKDFDQLHKDAGNLGIRAEELAQAYIKNSQYLAKLGGLTGYTTESFNRLLRSIKDTSIELGMNFNTSLDIASYMIETTFTKMEEGSDAFDRLINTTQTYQKYLQKLSFATGKSVENILQEQKAREQDIAFQAWQKNGKNAPIASFLNAIGASREVIDAFVTGMPNEAFTLASVSSPEMGRILSELMAISNDMSLTTEEVINRISELGSTINKEQLQSVLNYPRPLLNALPTKGGMMMGLNMSTMNWKEAMGYKETPEIFQQISKLSDNFTKMIEKFFEKVSLNKDSLNAVTTALGISNKILNEMGKDGGTIDIVISNISNWMTKLFNFAGSFDSEKMNKTIDNVEIFFFRLNRAIGYLLNGDLFKAKEALTNLSEGELNLRRNQISEKKNTYDKKLEDLNEKIKSLENKEEISNDDIILKEKLEKEREELLTKNNEIKKEFDELFNDEKKFVEQRRSEMTGGSQIMDFINWLGNDGGFVNQYLPEEYQEALEKLKIRQIDFANLRAEGVDNATDDIDKALISYTDLQKQAHIKNNLEELEYLNRQVKNMAEQKGRDLSIEEITTILDEFGKRYPAYAFEGNLKSYMSGILEQLQIINKNSKDIRVQNEQKDNLSTY